MSPPILRAAVFLVLGLLLAPTAAAASPVLAKGKGVEVTQEELDEAFINLRGAMAAQGRPVPEPQRALFERQLLEKLVLTKLLMNKATDEDKAQAKEKVGKILAEEKSRAKSVARFEAQVRAAGLSPASFEAQLLERATCEEVMDRELRPKLGVTPEKVREFYESHANDFRQPERLRLRQVVLSLRGTGGNQITDGEKSDKKALAGALVERARKGEDFEALVKQYSDDPVGRDRGGEYIFPVGKMVPEFEVAVLGLAPEQISDVISTPYAYHVVKVLSRLPGEQTPLEKISEQIRLRLELEATQAMLPEFQKQVFESAGVQFPKSE